MKQIPKLLILVGAPASGKTTYAKYLVRTEENWFRLSRDDFRSMNFNASKMDDDGEKRISLLFDTSIETLLKNKYNVVVDATHCKAEYINNYINKFNTKADIEFKVFEASFEELQERAKKRYEETGYFMPDHVIKKFMNELETLKQSFDFSTRQITKEVLPIAEQDETLPKAIICDIDGTLAINNDRDIYDYSKCDEDNINNPVANAVKAMHNQGYKIIITSGRPESAREKTHLWLKNNNIEYCEMFMRKDNDYRKDSVVKKELYDENIKGKYFINNVFDDRDQVVNLWRKTIGLSCFQVNYGDF
jgi:predicted kinase